MDVQRKDAEIEVEVKPVLSADGSYKAGIWVRDSSAGIGTLTFVDPSNNTFAGLGHAISDSDTGTNLPLLTGAIVPVTIPGCIKGSAGSRASLPAARPWGLCRPTT